MALGSEYLGSSIKNAQLWEKGGIQRVRKSDMRRIFKTFFSPKVDSYKLNTFNMLLRVNLSMQAWDDKWATLLHGMHISQAGLDWRNFPYRKDVKGQWGKIKKKEPSIGLDMEFLGQEEHFELFLAVVIEAIKNEISSTKYDPSIFKDWRQNRDQIMELGGKVNDNCKIMLNFVVVGIQYLEERYPTRKKKAASRGALPPILQLDGTGKDLASGKSSSFSEKVSRYLSRNSLVIAVRKNVSFYKRPVPSAVKRPEAS